MLALRTVPRVRAVLGGSDRHTSAQAIDCGRPKFPALLMEDVEDAPDRVRLRCLCILHGTAHWLRQGLRGQHRE